jgi:hypothetical protein
MFKTFDIGLFMLARAASACAGASPSNSNPVLSPVKNNSYGFPVTQAMLNKQNKKI